MTQTAVFAGNAQPINFLNVFVRSKRTPRNQDVFSPEARAVDPILDWFEKSSMLDLTDFKSIPAGKIFQSDQAIIKFKLSEFYHDRFVLLRGLLEFSRPRWIYISSNSAERTFELILGTAQATEVIEYLELILRFLIQEIGFKKSLKAILRFQESVRVEQSRLYRELQNATH